MGKKVVVEDLDVVAESSAIRLVWDRNLEQFSEPEQVFGRRKAKIREGYFGGWIPLEWLTQACRLPGKAPNVALAIWYVRGLRVEEPFRLNPDTLALFGVSHRDVYSRAAAVLEQAGLIRVTREPGKSLAVSVVVPR